MVVMQVMFAKKGFDESRLFHFYGDVAIIGLCDDVVNAEKVIDCIFEGDVELLTEFVFEVFFDLARL